MQQIRSWLSALPFDEAMERRQAQTLQLLLLSLIGAAVLDLGAILITPAPLLNRLIVMIVALIFLGCMLGALRLLRRGRLEVATTATVATLLLAITLALTLTGLREQQIVLLVFMLPIVLAGLLLQRRGLVITLALSLVIPISIALLEQLGVPFIGQAPLAETLISVFALFTIILGLLGVFLDRLNIALREALAAAHAREQDLDRLRVTLEATVSERTAALQTALAEVQARADAQAQMLAELEQQRTIVRDLSVPVIPISATTLVLPLVGALDSARLEHLQVRALQAVEHRRARSLVLDITGVPLVDSLVAEGLLGVVQAAKLMGATVMLVGIRPEVAQTIVELGLPFEMIHTFSDLQAALTHSQLHSEAKGVDDDGHAAGRPGR
jgi:rsbT co-antagonist protein RsbR